MISAELMLLMLSSKLFDIICGPGTADTAKGETCTGITLMHDIDVTSART